MDHNSVHTLPKTLLAFFWHFIKKHWLGVLAVQIFFFGWSLDHTLMPWMISLVIDTISNFEGDKSTMWSALAFPLCFGAVLWIGVEVFYRLAGFLSAVITPSIEASVRMAMFNYVQHHSHSYFSTHFAGSLSNKISDMPQSMTRIMQMVMSLFLPGLLTLMIATGFFAMLQPIFALILVSWFTIHIAICIFCAKKCDYYSNVHAESRSHLSGKIVDSFSNHLNVRLFPRHRYELQYLKTFQNDEQRKHHQSLIYIEKMKIALGVAAFLGAGLTLNWYMLYCWQQGTITTGEVVYIFTTASNVTMMAWMVGLELPNLLKEIGVCRQAMTIVQDEHDVIDSPDANTLAVPNGEVIFENVTFNYTPNHNVFENKTIHLEAGHKIGLVGFSGSGKTTFVNLILRYFDLEEGRILIDGQDIATVSQASLRAHISMIPQDTCLFHRTLMENIRYGRLDATDEEVIEASKKAFCHEFIEKLPDKYHTLAGERGVTLSGGQRQRIAIARAILKNSPILILDEATASLDSVTEHQIQEGLSHLMVGRTCLVIAHRLSTLSGMNRILVFKEGQIVEDGTHDELLEAGNHYATMWNMQAGGFLPDDPEYW